VTRPPKKRRLKKTSLPSGQSHGASSTSVEPDAESLDESTEKSRPGDSRPGDTDKTQSLVWRAILFGAATALVLVVVPSFLVAPRLGRTDLTAVAVSPEGSLSEVTSHELPNYSAGIAPGNSAGKVLVAVPGQKRIDVIELVEKRPTLADTDTAVSSGTDSTTTVAAEFAVQGSIPVEGGPVMMATSASRGIVLVIENASSDIKIVDLASNEITRSISAGKRPVAVAISEEEALAAIANLESASTTLVDLPSYSTKDVGVSEMARCS
jgi:hypothetical protein